MTPWGAVRRLAGRCPSDGVHRRRDTGELIRVYCERGRHELGWHTWGPDVWLAEGQTRPELP